MLFGPTPRTLEEPPGPCSQIFPTPGHSPLVGGALEARMEAVAAGWKPSDVAAIATTATSNGVPLRPRRARDGPDAGRALRKCRNVPFRLSCIPSTVF